MAQSAENRGKHRCEKCGLGEGRKTGLDLLLQGFTRQIEVGSVPDRASLFEQNHLRRLMGHSDPLGHILGGRSIFDDVDEVNRDLGIGGFKGTHVLMSRLADIAPATVFEQDSDALLEEDIDLGRLL